MQLQQYEKRLEKIYALDVFTSDEHKPVTEDALSDFEERHAPIPAEYRWLLRRFGGCYLVEPWINTLEELEECYDDFQESYTEYMSGCDHGSAFPIGGLGDGSIVFIDLKSGRVQGYNSDYDNLEEIADSFPALMLDIAQQALEINRQMNSDAEEMPK